MANGGATRQHAPLRHSRYWRALSWALLLAVATLSLLPRLPPLDGTGWDKSNHLLGYAALMWCFYQSYGASRARLSAVLLVLFGALIEVVQPLSGRWFEFLDIVANALGVALGWLLARGPAGRVVRWLDERL